MFRLFHLRSIVPPLMVFCLATSLLGSFPLLAQPPQLTLSLRRQRNEPYQTFLRRAHTLAETAIQRSFVRDRSLRDLRVVVVGENGGAIAPVLSASVSRQRWMAEPNLQRWATYFEDSKPLLGFESPPIPSRQPPQAEVPPPPDGPGAAEKPKPSEPPPPTELSPNPLIPPSAEEPPPPPRPSDRLSTPQRRETPVEIEY